MSSITKQRNIKIYTKTKKQNTTEMDKEIAKENKYINQNIINILETVKNHYAKLKNNIHVNAYERAIYQIKKWPHTIKHGKDIAHLEGIGKGMIQKIDTIIATGTLPIIKEQKLTMKKDRQMDNKMDTKSGVKITLDNLPITKILGFGDKISKELQHNHGITTVLQLQEIIAQGKYTPNTTQEIGLKYYKDLEQPIPRQEISEIGSFIEGKIEKYSVLDGNRYGKILTFLAGSYPSGLKQFSKDIDLLLVSDLNDKHLLDKIIKHLQKYIEIIPISLGSTKFLGLIKYNDVWRHIDIRLVNSDAFPYAYLYFSSGKIFNKLIREKLKKKGYKLNEWGLFSQTNGKQIHLAADIENIHDKNKIYNKKTLLEYSKKIEQEIFKIADLPYKTITERY